MLSCSPHVSARMASRLTWSCSSEPPGATGAYSARWSAGAGPSSNSSFGPPTAAAAGAPAAIRLVAADRFVRTLRISADGSEVARLACGEPFGQCVFDLLEVADGSIARYNK